MGPLTDHCKLFTRVESTDCISGWRINWTVAKTTNDDLIVQN